MDVKPIKTDADYCAALQKIELLSSVSRNKLDKT